MKNFILIFILAAFFFVPQRIIAEDINFKSDTITVNGCKFDVYLATNAHEQVSGMLGFTDNTFKKQGMIFLGETNKTRYFHTVGMEMNIVIMGLTKIGEKSYKTKGKPIYAKPGIETIPVEGESVLEVPTLLFEKDLKICFK